MWAIIKQYDDGLKIEISWVKSEKVAKVISRAYEKKRGVKPYSYTYGKSEVNKNG